MPGITFGTLPVIDTRELAKMAVRNRKCFPHSNPLDWDWYGKANSFRDVKGPAPGVGWVVMLKEHLDQLIGSGGPSIPQGFTGGGGVITAGGITLTFDDGEVVKSYDDLFVRRVKCVSAGEVDDPDAVYLIRFEDSRSEVSSNCIYQQFNVMTPEYPDFDLFYSSTTVCGGSVATGPVSPFPTPGPGGGTITPSPTPGPGGQGPGYPGTGGGDDGYPGSGGGGQVPGQGYLQSSQSSGGGTGGGGTTGFSTSPMSWEDMVRCIWDQVGSLGAFPGLPYAPHGVPYNFKFIGISAYLALNHVLARLCLALSKSGTGYTLVRIGSTGPGGDASALLTRWVNRRMDDGDPRSFTHAATAANLKVLFHKRDWSYGYGDDTHTTIDQWSMRPAYEIDLETGIIGAEGTICVWDDLPAKYDQSGGLVNLPDLEARAAERLACWVQRQSVGGEQFHVWYSGLCNGDWIDQQEGVTAVHTYDWGNGIKTEVINRDEQITNPAEYWPESRDTILAPPQIIRNQRPYHRRIYAILSSDLEPYGFATATVLWRPQQTFGFPGLCFTMADKCDWPLFGFPAFVTSVHPPGKPSPGEFALATSRDWRPVRKPPLINVHDYHGDYLATGTRVTLDYHWQSGFWIVVKADDIWFYAALLARSGNRYSWIEVDYPPGSVTAYPVPRPPARCRGRRSRCLPWDDTSARCP